MLEIVQFLKITRFTGLAYSPIKTIIMNRDLARVSRDSVIHMELNSMSATCATLKATRLQCSPTVRTNPVETDNAVFAGDKWP